MARGFDSKSVEEQQAEYLARRTRPEKEKLSPEEVARVHERESLLLSRKQVESQLKLARSDQHRQMLQAALAEIDSKLQELGS
jgi:hypothetical protein